MVKTKDEGREGKTEDCDLSFTVFNNAHAESCLK